MMAAFILAFLLQIVIDPGPIEEAQETKSIGLSKAPRTAGVYQIAEIDIVAKETVGFSIDKTTLDPGTTGTYIIEVSDEGSKWRVECAGVINSELNFGQDGKPLPFDMRCSSTAKFMRGVLTIDSGKVDAAVEILQK